MKLEENVFEQQLRESSDEDSLYSLKILK